MIATKDLVDDSGCLGVGVQLSRVTMETAPLQSIDEIAQKLVSIFLSSESKVPRDGYKKGVMLVEQCLSRQSK